MATAANIGKKVKRTGEAALFSEQTGKLTDEAFSVCKVLGIEPKELYPKNIESFLKKGASQDLAQRRWQAYEEQRKMNIEIVLKEVMMNNPRHINRKATSVLNRLAMPHDERMLKSAFKTSGGKASASALYGSVNFTQHRRGGGLSQTPYQNKAYDLSGNVASMTPGNASPELDRLADVEKKYEKQQRRWEMVLDKKHVNTDMKHKHMKELLAKKFKREKEMGVKAKEKAELKLYDDERRQEMIQANKERKLQQDKKLEQQKNRELNASFKKQQIVSQRRFELLNERATMRNIYNAGQASNRNFSGVNKAETSSQVGGANSSQAVAPMKQRAFSSTGRTQAQFKQLHEMEEVEAIQTGLQKYELRMQRATELRKKKQSDLCQNMKNLTNRVNEKIVYVQQQQVENFEHEFEKNVMKRKKIEDKKKKRHEEMNQDFEFNQEKKMEKLMGVQARQQQNKQQQDKKNMQLERRWAQIKKRGTSTSKGQAAMQESMAARQEMNQRRQWIQQMNLERKKRQQQDYKVLLVDKLQHKESRAQLMNERKTQLIDHGQRMNQTMQENFYRTTAVTQNAILPMPFENHKKEFDNTKEVKPQEKVED